MLLDYVYLVSVQEICSKSSMRQQFLFSDRLGFLEEAKRVFPGKFIKNIFLE
jgi:hypothetical protein